MIQANYKLLADLDQDGFFCEGVQPTDPLNLIVGARQKGLTWSHLFVYPDFEAVRTYGMHASGVWTYRAIIPAAALDNGVVQNGLSFGAGRIDPAPPGVPDIPVSPETQYNVRIEARVTAGDLSAALQVFDQTGTLLAQSGNALTLNTWKTIDLAFTTNETTTHIKFLLFQQIASGDQALESRGLMLVEGSTLPAVYNAGSPTNVYDDVSRYVERVDYQWGIVNYSDAISQPGSMTVLLKNIGGEWTPENPSSPLYPLRRGFLLKLNATYNAVEYTLFQGVMDSLRTAVGEHGTKTATLQVGDPLRLLSESEYLQELMLNVTTDEVLQAMFDAGVIIYPYRGHYWMLGVEGASELSSSAIVFLEQLADFEAGDSTFAYAGDITDDSAPVSADTLIREYVYAEMGGRFIWHPPTLTFKFLRRSHFIRTESTPVPLPLTELDEPPKYVWGDDLINHFTVNYFPRRVGSVGATLYSLAQPLALSAGDQRTMRVRYTDPNAKDRWCGGLNIIPAVSGTDYVANANQDGSGANKTALLSVYITPGATGAEISLTNNDSGVIYITTLQIRGTPLTTYDRQSAIAVDGESIILHSEYRRTLDLTALDDAEQAQEYANILLQRYKTPFGRIGNVSIWGNRSAANLEKVLGLDFGDVVEVFDSVAMNEIQNYIVTGMRHSITPQRHHWATYSLEPLDRSIFWILGNSDYSLLEQTTRLSL